MTWPDDTDLPIEIWAALGADPNTVTGGEVWTDLTDRLEPNPIPIRRGATAGGTTSPGSATLHLGNDDGALTPLRAQSEYHPHVVVGTPVWVALRRVEDSFGRSASNGWGTAESGQVWSTANGSASDYSVSGGEGRIAHTTLNVLRRVRLPVSMLDSHHLVDASTSALITGAALVTGVIARHDPAAVDYYWARTEFNAGSTTVMLKVTRVRGGVLTDLGSVGAVPGLSYAANVPLRTRVSVVGNRISMKVWTASGSEPAGWQLDVIDSDPLTAPGGVGVQSWLIAGNTNVGTVTASHDNYTVRADLMNGFADSWQPQFIPGADGVSSVVRVTVSGILRRLGQGKVPLSAATGYLVGTEPIFYHPMEDGADATQAASGLPDGIPMQVRRGVMDFTDDAPPGAAGSAHPLPSAQNALIGTIAGADTTGFQIGVWTKAEIVEFVADLEGYYIPWEVRTSTGQIFRLVMQHQAAVAIGVGHYTSEEATTATNFISLDDPEPHQDYGVTGDWIHVQFLAQQNGANADVFLYVDGELVDSATWTSLTLGAPIRVNAIGAFAGSDPSGISNNIRDIWISQLVLHDFANFQVVQHDAGLGFPFESASDRMERVAAERGVRIDVHPGDSEPLGPQPVGGLLDVVRDAELADMGILYERGWGLAYRPRSTRYNQDPALVVDLAPPNMYSQETRPESVVAPTYDDRGIRNDVTVSRRDGSSARVVDAGHAARHGTYDDSVELGVATDAVLPYHAGWRVHLGTWEEMRYPGIPVDLAGNPDLIDAWLNLLPGDRAQQVNVPSPHPGYVDQVADGMSHTIRQRDWSGQVVGTPAGPWTAGVVEDDSLGRADTDGSRWVGSVDAGSDTSERVLVTAGDPWITTATHPSQFPLTILSAGVELSVTGIATVARDTFTRSVAAGSWGSATTGQTWSVNSGSSANFSVTGSVGRITTATINQLEIATIDVGGPDHDPRYEFVLPVTPTGSGFTFRSLARYVDTSNYYQAELLVTSSAVVELRLHKRVAGSATQLGSTVTLTGAHTAGDRYILQCSAIDSTIRARAWRSSQPVELGWHITVTDTAHTTGTRVGVGIRREASNTNGSTNIDVDNFEVPSLQTMTFDATPVNGVTKTIPAGSSLSLATPWRPAL